VRFVGFVGALLFAYLARAIGAKRAVMAALIIWAGVVIYAYGFIERNNPVQFFALAAVIALVLGGTLAVTRALFLLMIPRGQEASGRPRSGQRPRARCVCRCCPGSTGISILHVRWQRRYDTRPRTADRGQARHRTYRRSQCNRGAYPQGSRRVDTRPAAHRRPVLATDRGAGRRVRGAGPALSVSSADARQQRRPGVRRARRAAER
jgi:hypothetical protein